MCIYTSAVNVQGHLLMSDPETDTHKQKTQTSVTTLPSAVAAEGKLCHLPVNDIILSPLLVHLWTWGTPLEAMGPRGDGGDGGGRDKPEMPTRHRNCCMWALQPSLYPDYKDKAQATEGYKKIMWMLKLKKNVFFVVRVRQWDDISRVSKKWILYNYSFLPNLKRNI